MAVKVGRSSGVLITPIRVAADILPAPVGPDPAGVIVRAGEPHTKEEPVVPVVEVVESVVAEAPIEGKVAVKVTSA